MTEAAPAEAGAAAEKKGPLLRRVPTSLIVTLVGIVLTAWLLPAFTRQWDDRQKAHAIQAGIVNDIATSSARLLLGGEALARLDDLECTPPGRVVTVGTPQHPSRDDLFFRRCYGAIARREHRVEARIGSPWALASLQLEARLQAYVNPKVVTAWQVYSWFIDVFDRGDRIQAKAEFAQANSSHFNLEPGAARAAATLIRLGDGGPVVPDTKDYRSATEVRILHHLEARLKRGGYVNFHRRTDGGSGFAVVPVDTRAVERALLIFEQEIAREVLSSDVTGYSTTTHDLIHDLIP